MTILCHIRYTIDPFKRDAFEHYAGNWATLIPKCGGRTLGYFMPYEGTNNIALGLNLFEDLADYETYRRRLEEDDGGADNYSFAQKERIILGEERMFLRPAKGHE
jgi:hypothetical protein